jgi:putative MFS transporter
MYLVSKGLYTEAHVLVSKIEKELGVPVGELSHPAEMRGTSTKKFGFMDLWSPLYLRRTICLWVLWFGMVYSYYGIFTWLPSLLVKSGHTLIRSFEFLLYMTLAQIPGYFTAAYFVDKIGRKATMGTLLAICALSAYMFGRATSAEDIVLWGCVMSFCNLGAWGITHAYSAEQYPTHARATGVGWAAACGRIGGIIAPIVVGSLMTGSDQYGTVFMMFTVVLAIIAMDIIFLGKETMNKSLDELTEKQPVPNLALASTSSTFDDAKG